MKLSDYPALKKAFEYMLYDNVAEHSICAHILRKMDDANLVELEGVPDLGKFFKANDELSALKEEDFFEVCCGDQDSCVEVSPDTGEVLHFLFEEIHV